MDANGNGQARGIGAGFVFLRQVYVLENELLAKGQLIDGAIQDCQFHQQRDGYYIHVKYQFTAPTTGRQLKPLQRVHRDDLKGGYLPNPGTPIKVLYLKDSRHEAM
jgi:hypothetical protein